MIGTIAPPKNKTNQNKPVNVKTLSANAIGNEKIRAPIAYKKQIITAFRVCGPPAHESEHPPRRIPNVGAETQLNVKAIET